MDPRDVPEHDPPIAPFGQMAAERGRSPWGSPVRAKHLTDTE